MALIKCPECGKEISDKAPACINCGCPVSAMKAEPAKPAAGAANLSNLNETFGQFFGNQANQPQSASAKPAPAKPAPVKTEPARPAQVRTAPAKTVPPVAPEVRMFRGIIISILDKCCGICGMAGFLAVGSLVVGLLSGEHIDGDFFRISFLGIPAALVLQWLSNLLTFFHYKKFLRKEGCIGSIRNETAPYTNSLNAFRLYPSMLMARYLKWLNPNVGNELVAAVKKVSAERWKKRFGYLPYLLILMAVYYLLPRLEMEMYLLPYESSLIICHVVTLVVMAVFGRKKELTLGLIVTIGVLFTPTIYAYYFIDEMWYHILICAAAALVGALIGGWRRK